MHDPAHCQVVGHSLDGDVCDVCSEPAAVVHCSGCDTTFVAATCSNPACRKTFQQSKALPMLLSLIGAALGSAFGTDDVEVVELAEVSELTPSQLALLSNLNPGRLN